MKAVKLTDKQLSEFRDNFARNYCTGITGVGKEFAIKEAYVAADIALRIREDGVELLEADCGCKEAPKRIIPTVVPKDRLTFKVDRKQPPVWVFILLLLLTICGISTVLYFVYALISMIF